MTPRGGSSEKKARTKLICPACGHQQLARIARRGFLRTKLYPAFGFYPWECAMCRKEFLIRKRAAGYRRASPSREERVGAPESQRESF